MSDLADLLGKEEFAGRHLGPDGAAQREMLAALRVDSLDALVREVVPAAIRLKEPLKLGAPESELQALAELSAHAVHNEVWRNYIGMGYYGTHTPAVIQRNVMENPGWYTAYTPYQAEISQGRLEALLNFQQLVIDLTGLPVANASLLDEATAAAEAMAMIRRLAKSKANAFFVDEAVHPQVVAVMRTRAKWMGIELVVAAADEMDPAHIFGAHFQYPDTYGRMRDWTAPISAVHAAGGLVSLGTDLLALLLIRSPGAYGADIAIGSAPRFQVPSAVAVRVRAQAKRLNLRYIAAMRVGVSCDETTSIADIAEVAEAITGERVDAEHIAQGLTHEPASIPAELRRRDPVLTHPVFNRYHTETEMMRYLKRLENRDFSLVHGMIPLGSCTMKLNAAAELIPLSWPKFATLHPFAPPEQASGTRAMMRELEAMLAEITGFARVSLQPNSGAQGEYAGLLAIRTYYEAKREARDICLIPASAHGTNPASAQMMGLRIVVVGCDPSGNVDLADLERKVAEHRERLAVLMVTYPSTHGVFEEGITRICELVHAAGGQVYMDGANMNALAGLAKPGQFGADVCHINLHKTFCIPHGGGGPGMGPIAVASHLAGFLPEHPLVETGGATGIGPVSAAPWGSASILLISWTYIRMMGAAGLERASEIAI